MHPFAAFRLSRVLLELGITSQCGSTFLPSLSPSYCWISLRMDWRIRMTLLNLSSERGDQFQQISQGISAVMGLILQDTVRLGASVAS